MKKIQISSFLDYNREQHTLYMDASEVARRMLIREQDGVDISVLKCMDGRVNYSIFTNQPFGIVYPYKTIGGQFQTGSHFGEIHKNSVAKSWSKGRPCLIIVTYHWSKGDPSHRGCKGFDCKVDDARKYTENLAKQIDVMFGKNHAMAYPIQIGMETDHDALVLHGINGQTLDLSEVQHADSMSVLNSIRELYPDMSERMLACLLRQCMGNIAHIAEIKLAGRPVADIEHKETVLGIGRGYDWYHKPNSALIVGPYTYDLKAPTATAASIILGNIQAGRVSAEEGCALIASGNYRDEGPDKVWAAMKALQLLDDAIEVIREQVPELLSYLDSAAGILNEHTREFTIVRKEDAWLN